MDKPNFFKEMPIGLAMSLGMNEFAMDFYAGLDSKKRESIKQYVQRSTSGDDAKKRIRTAVQELEKHNLDFLD